MAALNKILGVPDAAGASAEAVQFVRNYLEMDSEAANPTKLEAERRAVLAQVEAARTEIGEAEAETRRIVKQREEVEVDMEDLWEEVEERRSAVAAAKSDLEELKGECAALRRDLAKLNGENAKLAKQKADIAAQVAKVRKGGK
jgi:chromosome segregation ATPase